MEENAKPQANANLPETEPIEQTTPTEQPKAEPKIKVKYNHEEKELTYDEAVTLAQMGMNYPKIKEQLDALKNDEAIQFFSELEKELGVPRTEVIKQWREQREQERIAKIAEDEGIDEKAAKKLFEAEQIKAEREAEQRKKQLEEETKKQREERLEQEEDAFHKAFPNVKNEDVPQPVLDQWNNGIPLVTAYENHTLKEQIKTMEEKLNAAEVNKANAEKSMGAVESKGDTKPIEFTADSVKKMTSEQRQKNMPKILEAIKSGKLKAF